MQAFGHKYFWYAAAAVAAVLGAINMFSGTGPIDLAQARTLTEAKLRFEKYRLEAIVSDGTAVLAPGAALTPFEIVDCPQVGSRRGTGSGRHGQLKPSHAAASFDCLYARQMSGGVKVYFAAYIYRSAAPGYRGDGGGHILTFRKHGGVRKVIEDLKIPLTAISAAEREQVRAALEGKGMTQKDKIDFGAALRRSIERD